MKNFTTILREEKAQLEKITLAAERRLKGAPEGHLRIARKGKRTEYYWKKDRSEGEADNDKNGKYMRKREKAFAQKLAQKDYDLINLKSARERIKAIDIFLRKYEKTDLKEIYRKTNPERLALIQPLVLSDEEYARRWQSVEYLGKNFSDETQEIITEKGERVRSKSEKIIADKLYALGIPYRYEYPLYLDGNIRIFPDFTILKMPERKEVYLEHLGMMDNESYVEKTILKLGTYERNGIFLGVNLFITFETSKKPINTRVLDQIFKEVFCEE